MARGRRRRQRGDRDATPAGERGAWTGDRASYDRRIASLAIMYVWRGARVGPDHGSRERARRDEAEARANPRGTLGTAGMSDALHHAASSDTPRFLMRETRDVRAL